MKAGAGEGKRDGDGGKRKGRGGRERGGEREGVMVYKWAEGSRGCVKDGRGRLGRVEGGQGRGGKVPISACGEGRETEAPGRGQRAGTDG